MRTRDIKTNALYEVRGVICRVKKLLKNGRFLVRHHKVFHAIVEPKEIKKIEIDEVREYLE